MVPIRYRYIDICDMMITMSLMRDGQTPYINNIFDMSTRLQSVRTPLQLAKFGQNLHLKIIVDHNFAGQCTVRGARGKVRRLWQHLFQFFVVNFLFVSVW